MLTTSNASSSRCRPPVSGLRSRRKTLASGATSSVAEVRGSVLANFHRDLLEGIAAVRGRPGVDASRVAILASGMSNASAVKTARLDPSVRSLVLMSGLIPEVYRIGDCAEVRDVYTAMHEGAEIACKI